MLAGNSPTGCIASIAQGALVKAINVFKMPSSDPFTCVAMLRTMADAYKVQALRGARLSAWKALHAATLGAAQGLGLAGEIGSFEVGRTADVVVWDWAVGPVAEHRQAVARDLHERVFAWMTQGDERNVVATFVAGGLVHERG